MTKEINWKLIDEYLEAGYNGVQIAELIDVSRDTLYDRCQKEKNSTFSAYSQRKNSQGKADILRWQHDLARERNERMLMYLGKVRCGQRENKENGNEELINDFKAFLEFQQNRSTIQSEGTNKSDNVQS